ncbi:MAG: NUDIX domain-containing protein [Gammaproteobacteria bacterium]|jgi:bis(5'-nucleosidyl)-tetraphosphatase|nr:NUDIX domain-containing protein [Gammaproteobacteria bacterium]MDP6617394.1 NUDIX domain-containing protein [Gammaproteobacteria bacterium]MDP6694641.1 NUDIX domain-containing protein [Gammaproteobacteria bacterium]
MNKKAREKLSCGIVIVRKTAEGPLLLMLRAFNHWDFPKGMLKEGETPRQAALREVAEESTITEIEFAWGDASLDTGPYGRSKTARYFIGVTSQEAVTLPVNPEIGRPEHHEWRWLSLNEARSLVTPRVELVLDWAEKQMNNLPE